MKITTSDAQQHVKELTCNQHVAVAGKGNITSKSDSMSFKLKHLLLLLLLSNP